MISGVFYGLMERYLLYYLILWQVHSQTIIPYFTSFYQHIFKRPTGMGIEKTSAGFGKWFFKKQIDSHK
jgi:hypothetical protein